MAPFWTTCPRLSPPPGKVSQMTSVARTANSPAASAHGTLIVSLRCMMATSFPWSLRHDRVEEEPAPTAPVGEIDSVDGDVDVLEGDLVADLVGSFFLAVRVVDRQHDSPLLVLRV